jgi:hypothetical protein
VPSQPTHGRFPLESLFIGFIAGVFGVAYFIYGKKQQKLTPMIAGALLCIYPYFVESALWSAVIGAALLAAPFVIDF